jgi:hypothetical protein
MTENTLNEYRELLPKLGYVRTAALAYASMEQGRLNSQTGSEILLQLNLEALESSRDMASKAMTLYCLSFSEKAGMDKQWKEMFAYLAYFGGLRSGDISNDLPDSGQLNESALRSLRADLEVIEETIQRVMELSDIKPKWCFLA